MSTLRRRVKGLSPGRKGASNCHRSRSAASRGTTPARTSDDLPVPDAPSTSRAAGARWARLASRSPSFSIALSCPKNTGACSASKASRPG